MNRRAALLGGLGAGLAALAGAIAVQPELADRVGLVDLLAGVENVYLPVAGAGVVAVVYGFLVWISWSAGGSEQATPPDVETAFAGRVPGAELDVALPELAGERGRAARPVEHRDLIRERLRADAVETVARLRSRPREETTTVVASGEWTDDRYASDLLGGDDAPGPSWYQRLWHGLRRRDPFVHRVERTVESLEDLGGEP